MNRTPISIGDKFRTGTGIWKVMQRYPGGRLVLFNEEKALFSDRYCREVRTWKRVKE